MQKIKSLKGYTIYIASAKDEKKYNGICEGDYPIYFSSDIKDYGLSNADVEYIASNLQEALEFCNGSNYALAREFCEERNTCVSFEEIERMEKILDKREGK